jgi:signal transduction histidine kinase
MSQGEIVSQRISRPAPIILAAIYFFYLVVILRTLAEPDFLPYQQERYLALELLFGVLFTLMLWHPSSRPIWQHLYFIFQSLLVLSLLIPWPGLDFLNVLLVLLCFQSPLVFPGRARWVWVAILLLIILLSLTILLGLRGLALASLPGTAGLIFPAYVVIAQEIEAGQRKRQALLSELQEANRRLTAYAGQVEELAAIQERDHLARELHDSVSQTIFSISLYSRSARILLERDPQRLRPHLEQLQILTQSALEETRSLIADLHPQKNETDNLPTS